MLDTVRPTNYHKLNKHIQGSLMFRITIESLCKTRYFNRKLSPKSENKIPAQFSPFCNPPSILIHSLHLFGSSIASPLLVHYGYVVFGRWINLFVVVIIIFLTDRKFSLIEIAGWPAAKYWFGFNHRLKNNKFMVSILFAMV